MTFRWPKPCSPPWGKMPIAPCVLNMIKSTGGENTSPIAEAHTAPGCFTLKLQEGGRCYVFGGGHVSQALVPLLSGVDFCCVVLDERPDYATPALFPTAEARCGPPARASGRHSLYHRG